MQEIDADAADAYAAPLGNARRPGFRVIVAADGSDGRQRAQLLEHRCRANIARMQDTLRALEEGSRLGPHETVRVGNETDSNHPARLRPPVR